MLCKYFLPFSRLPFYSTGGFLCCAEAFYFDVLLCRSFLFRCSPTCLFLLLLHSFLVSDSKKSLPGPMSRGLLPPMFSSRSFMVSGLILTSLIHFELVFVCGVRQEVQFHSFACGYIVFPAPFIEETVFSPLYNLGFCVIN